MTGSTTKKVVVRRFERELLQGFVNPQGYLQPEGLELLTPDGAVVLVPYQELKSVCVVRDWVDDQPEPKVFLTRPKMDGLWVRMHFRDGEVMDGILSNNLLQWEAYGFTVVPPEPASNNQRIFLPRQALLEMQVLGVVGSPLTRRRKRPVAKEQIGLFEE